MLVTESCSFPVSGLFGTVRQRASIAAGAGICLGRMTFPLVEHWGGKYNRWLRIGLETPTHIRVKERPNCTVQRLSETNAPRGYHGPMGSLRTLGAIGRPAWASPAHARITLA